MRERPSRPISWPFSGSRLFSDAVLPFNNVARIQREPLFGTRSNLAVVSHYDQGGATLLHNSFEKIDNDSCRALIEVSCGFVGEYK